MGKVVWLTGLPCSGKTTIANEVMRLCVEREIKAYHLDGDVIRNTPMSQDVGFSPEDRAKHLGRIGCIARMLAESGIIAICSFVSPSAKVRDDIRKWIVPFKFIEVWVKTPLDICEERDVKGMYARARKGEITNFTGIGAPYEQPDNPEIVIDTTIHTPAFAASKILSRLLETNG